MRRVRAGLAAVLIGLAGHLAEAQPSPIANVSVLLQVPPGSGALTPPLGFAVTAPTGILVRAVGPTLASFGISNTVTDPVVQYYDGAGTVIGFVNPALALNYPAIFASVGAFPFLPQAGGTDFADVETFTPGTYSIRVEDLSKNGGTTLVELYSGAYRYAGIGPGTVPSAAPGYISNFSVLLQIPPGGAASPLGFVVSTASEYLIRAIGPSLAGFGVSNAAPAPTVALLDSSGNNLFNENSVQPQPTNYNFVFASVGAFPLTAGAHDFYRTILIGPGAYSLIATDSSGKGGSVLIEVYANPDLGPTVE